MASNLNFFVRRDSILSLFYQTLSLYTLRSKSLRIFFLLPFVSLTSPIVQWASHTIIYKKLCMRKKYDFVPAQIVSKSHILTHKGRRNLQTELYIVGGLF